MKKTILFTVVLAFVGMMTSCLRDDDWNILKHPIHVTGTVDPTWGVPIASGEMNMNDLLSHLSSEYQGVIDPDSNVITVTYDMSASDTIWAFSAISKKGSPKGSSSPKGNIYTKDSVILDTINIDLFSNVNSLDSISVAHAWLDLTVRAFSDYCSEMVRRNTTVLFDSLEIWYNDKAGNLKQFNPTEIDLQSFSVLVTDIREGFYHSFPTIDVAAILNDLPTRLITKYHLKFNVSDSIISQNIFSMSLPQILDSLRMTKFIYAADLDLQIPLSLQVKNMQTTFDLDLGAGLSSLNLDSIVKTLDEGISVEITNSKFTLNLENGIPLNLLLTARFFDANGVLKLTVFNNAQVPSSNVAQVPGDPLSWYATTPTQKTLSSQLNKNDLDKIKDAKTLQLTLTIDSNNKHVLLDRDDNLKVQAYMLVHPTANIDITITENGLMK